MNKIQKICGDGVRVAQPLFPVEGQGSIPMSPLQFDIEFIPKKTFYPLNRLWHSRLPECGNLFDGRCFGAIYLNVYFAVAWWSKPIAQNRFNFGKNIYELRRMAISPEAPKNTASRFLKVMTILIKREFPEIYRLISYQDTEVHKGTIYKASGWEPIETGKSFLSWKNRPGRIDQSTAVKIRWEKQIRPEPKNTHNQSLKIDKQKQTLLFAT